MNDITMGDIAWFIFLIILFSLIVVFTLENPKQTKPTYDKPRYNYCINNVRYIGQYKGGMIMLQDTAGNPIKCTEAEQ